MKKYIQSLNEYFSVGGGSQTFVPYLSKGSVSGAEYNTAPDNDYDSLKTYKNSEIRISQKEDGVFILSDGSYFVLKYDDPQIKPTEKYSHYFVYIDSDDSRVSLDKFRTHLDDLKDAFGASLKNTLIYSRDYNWKVVDNNGEIIQDKQK